METKERILHEALALFSERGYDGVSMRQIAAAVGIQAASLYSHYAGKEYLFRAILEFAQERFAETMHSLGLAADPDPQSVMELKEKDLQRISREIFLHLLKDPTAAALRRLLTAEQFRHSIAGQTYQHLYIESVLDSQTRIFKAFISAGTMRKGDPAITALHFYAPILLLLNKYDRQPDKEAKALAALEAHVNQFMRRYGRKGNKE